jgi:Mg-chelatase subunit ChlD
MLRHPAWLLLVAPAVALAWWSCRPARMDTRAALRWAAFVLRSAVGVAAAVALAGPVGPDRSAGPAVVFGVDLSDSYRAVAGDPGSLLSDAVGGWREPPERLRSAVVAFADEPRTVRPLSEGPPTGRETDAARGKLDGRATDLAAALRAMLSAAGTGTAGGSDGPRGDVRLVLMTDGAANRGGDLLAALAALPADAPPVYVWTAGLVGRTDARVASLRMPSRAVPGAAVGGRVSVVANRDFAVGLRVTRAGPGGPAGVFSKTLTLRAGRPADETFRDTPPGEGVFSYTAELVDAATGRAPPRGDALPQNDRLSAAVTVAGGRRVLVLTRSADGPTARAVRAVPGVSATVAAPERMPATAAELSAFEAVVLDDLPTDARPPPAKSGPLTAARAAALGEYVREFGGGLVAVGGADAFGPGGYHLSPLDALLPVDSDPRSRRPAAVCVALDRSGSMADPDPPGSAGPPKLRVAADAVLALQPPALNPRDQLAVLAFNTAVEVVRPLSAGVDWADLSRRLSALSAQRGTRIVPALEAGIAELAKSPAESPRRLLLVSDGIEEGSGADADAGLADPAKRADLLKRLTDARVRLSAVVTGPANAAVRELCERSGGRYYAPAEFREVPDRMLEDLFGSADFVRTGDIRVRAGDASGFAGLPEAAALPPLRRLTRTVAKPGSQVVLGDDSGDPVLAAAPAGAGRSVALPTALSPEWSGAWADSTAAAGLMRSALGWAMRPADDPDWTLTAEPTADASAVTLTLRHSLRRATLASADGRAVRATLGGTAAVTAELPQVGVGRYAATVPLTQAGGYTATASVDGRAVARAGFALGYPAEYARIGFDADALARLTERTGGRFIRSLDELTDWGRGAPEPVGYSGLAAAIALAFAAAAAALMIARRKGWV